MTGEWLAMERCADVITKELLIRDLRLLGVEPGMTLIVHSSLSSIGWVNGGPVTLIQALMETVTPQGTIVMPTHSGEYSDPANWQHPPAPENWWDTIRETMPAFDPAYTPSRGVGSVPEAFRSFPGVLRSYHPALSFAAWGRHARLITEAHGLDFGLGEQSPLARIYELDGWVLLLGVGHDSNTSLHLAENRVSQRKEREQSAPILDNGIRIWRHYREIDFDTDCFEEIGRAYEAAHSVYAGTVGAAVSRLLRQRDVVDFAVAWFDRTRGATD